MAIRYTKSLIIFVLLGGTLHLKYTPSQIDKCLPIVFLLSAFAVEDQSAEDKARKLAKAEESTRNKRKLESCLTLVRALYTSQEVFKIYYQYEYH
jgi:hypothetical protein